MPRIPTTQGPSVREQAFRSRGVSAQAPVLETPKIAGAASQLIGQVNDIRIQERDKAEQIESSALETRLRNKILDLTHNPETGFYKQKGKNTTVESDRYRKEYEDFAKAEIDAMGSERMKEKAGLISGRYGSSLNSQMAKHTFGEMEKYDTQQTQANLESIRSNAIINYDKNPEMIAGAVAEQTIQIKALAERKGMSKEATDAALLEANSQLQYGVISRAANNGDDLLAKEYYEKAKAAKQVDGDTATKIDRLLQASSTKGESQRQASMIMAEDMDREDSYAAAREIEDPDVRDATLARVKTRFNENELIKREAGMKSFNSVIDDMERFKTLDHVPVQELSAFKKEKKQVLGKLMEMISKGHEPKTDPRVHQDLWIMASDPRTRDKFLKTDINMSAHKLNTSDRKQLLKMRSDMAAGKGSKWGKKQKLYFSNTAVVNNHLDSLALDDKEERSVFKKAVLTEVMRREEDGKEMTQPEVTEIMDNLTKEVITGDYLLFNTTDPLYKLAAEEQELYFNKMKRK